MRLKKYKVKKKIYSPYKDGITQSLLTSWCSCREQSRLMLERVRPKRPNPAFLYGSFIHECHDYLIQCIIHKESINDSKIWVQKIYRSFISSNICKEFSLEEVEDILLKAVILFECYIDYYQMEYKKITWVDSEQKFETSKYVTVNDVEKKVILRGMIDGLFNNMTCDNINSRGLWIFETKTKSRIDESKIKMTLSKDFQVYYYLNSLCNKLEVTWPRGCRYNIIRKPQLRCGKKETLQQFSERLRSDIKKRPEHYFIQYDIPITPQDIKRYRKELDIIIKEFCEWRGDLKNKNYKNLDHCENKYGACQYVNYCHGANINYYKIIDNFFPELED